MHQEFIWVRLKLTFTCCSLRINYYFLIESIDTFYFVNNAVVYKAYLVQGKGGKLVYKILIVNLYIWYLCICHQPDNSDLFKGHGLGSAGRGLMDWTTVGEGGEGGGEVG